jgi:ATP-binding cassette subfamily G (WHITE) protein 2
LTKIVEGRPLANGKVYSSNDFSSFGVFVMQDDLLFATLTVKGNILIHDQKETLLFSARMKLRGPEKNKESVVDRIIEDL